MLKTAALAHFDQNHTRVAAEIGITRSAVSQWGEIVPLAAALQLERITNGKLQVDMSMYKGGRPVARRVPTESDARAAA